MSLVNRASLPQEFFDITSASLLVEPEPQYLHAMLIKMALSASFSPDAMLGMPGRQFGGSGAAYQGAEEGRLSLSDGLYDQAFHVIPELGKAPGHTVRINRPTYSDSTYTEASRTVASGQTISKTPINVSSAQVDVTIKRLAGPYDQTNGNVAPYGVDRFDGSVMMHRPAQIVGRNLKRDFDKTLDGFGVSLLDSGSTTVRPEGMTTDSTPAVAGDYPMTYAVVQDAEEDLDTKNIPYFGNGKRAMVLSPKQCNQLSQDADFNRLAKFHESFNPLFNGSYWRSVGTFDIFKSNTLLKPTNGNSVPVHHGQAFGPGAVGGGVGEMPRTAFASEDNYGETALVIWLWYAGFAVLDNRFITSIRTS